MKLAIKIVIGLLIFVCVILPIIILKKDKNKYICNTDGECVKDPQGTYNSESACKKKCTAPSDKYICKDGTCTVSSQGTYNSESACKKKCTAPSELYICKDGTCSVSSQGTYNSESECKNDCNNLKYGQTYLLQHVVSGKYLQSCGRLDSSECNRWTCKAGVGTLLGSPEEACATGKIKLLPYNDDKDDGQNVTTGDLVILNFVDTNLNLRSCGHFSENSKVMVIGTSNKWGFTINTMTQSPAKLTDEVWFTDGNENYIDVQNYVADLNECICRGKILVMSPTVTFKSFFQFVPVNNICQTAP